MSIEFKTHLNFRKMLIFSHVVSNCKPEAIHVQTISKKPYKKVEFIIK